MYRERPSLVPDAVAWCSTSTAPTRVLPDGCIDLLWFGDRLVVAGPDSTAHVVPSLPGGVAGLRFAAGVAPAFLGVPAVELRDQHVALDDLWPAAVVRSVSDQVGSSSDRLTALEAVAERWTRRARPDPVMREVARRVEAGSAIGALAAQVGLSERQLHRRSLVAYGYGPKTLGRIFRLGRALTLARSGADFASCAHRTGYVDQAHLARDVRALAGTTLSELVT